MIQVGNICVWGIMQEGLLYFKIDIFIRRAKIIKIIRNYKMGTTKAITKRLIKDIIIMLR
jgi:hypothetical protein